MVTKKWRWVLIIILCLSTIGLLCIASIGYFVRPMVDDLYFMSVDGSPPGHHLLNLSPVNGRLSSYILYSLSYPIPFFLRLIPLVTIIIITSGFYVPLRLFAKHKFKNNSQLIPITASTTATLVTLFMLPDLYSSVFWLSAAPVHVWSFSFTMIYLSLIWYYGRKSNPPAWWLSLLIFGLGALFIGDLYEASSGVLIISSLVILLLTYRTQIFAHRRIGWLSLAGSLASLVVLLFSPGALSRRNNSNSLLGSGMLDRISQLPQAIWDSFTSTTPGVLNNYGALIILLACTIVFSIFCFRRKIGAKKGAIIVMLATVACLLAAAINVAVVWVGEGQQLPPRAYFLPTMLLVILALVVGGVIGQVLKAWSMLWRGGAAGALLMLALVIALTSSFFIPYVRDFRGQVKLHTAAWDRRDAFIKQTIANNPGVCDLRVASLPLLGGGDISPQRNYWRNAGITSYYYPYYKFKDFNCRIYAQKWVPWAHRY